MDIIKICAVALLALLCIGLLRGKNAPAAMAVSLAVCAALTLIVVPHVTDILGFLRSLVEAADIDGELLTPILKIVGICLCVRLTGELCRDAGERAIAVKVELAGAVAGLLCALPLFERALRMIGAL